MSTVVTHFCDVCGAQMASPGSSTVTRAFGALTVKLYVSIHRQMGIAGAPSSNDVCQSCLLAAFEKGSSV